MIWALMKEYGRWEETDLQTLGHLRHVSFREEAHVVTLLDSSAGHVRRSNEHEQYIGTLVWLALEGLIASKRNYKWSFLDEYP